MSIITTRRVQQFRFTLNLQLFLSTTNSTFCHLSLKRKVFFNKINKILHRYEALSVHITSNSLKILNLVIPDTIHYRVLTAKMGVCSFNVSLQ